MRNFHSVFAFFLSLSLFGKCELGQFEQIYALPVMLLIPAIRDPLYQGQTSDNARVNPSVTHCVANIRYILKYRSKNSVRNNATRVDAVELASCFAKCVIDGYNREIFG